ncbi:hypothetical protein [Clostridium diolis]|uniref:DUF4231 domain-containing protein n=1 Tax=Clostridium diolis TaxID=223919 RepID=A0AAV3W7L4_9CLOT|nr:hypothetical protein [Clostridium diolis]QES71629.1 hypothetical protein F3K33_01850 [Clostridium diolis]GEA33638.1 hypothetical protein CDIOL_45610 [Clostridium diolis]
MRNKHIFKIGNYRNIHDSFEKQLELEADDIKQAYDNMLEVYKEKLNKNELNFEYEKAFLQSKINKNYSETFNYWEKVFFIIVTVYVTSMVNDAIKEYKEIGFAIVLLGLIAALIIFGKKDIRKERREYIYYTMRMEVLSGLQKLN